MTKYIKNILYSSLIILFLTLILTIFNYFNLISENIINIIILIIPLLTITINSYILGKKASNKGYIEGIKYSLIWISIFLILSIITNNFIYYNLIYYLIIIILSIISSIIGINRKKN